MHEFELSASADPLDRVDGLGSQSTVRAMIFDRTYPGVAADLLSYLLDVNSQFPDGACKCVGMHP